MIIKDPILEPYCIVVEGDNYILGIPKEYEQKNGTILNQMKSPSYFYDVSSLIKRIIKLKIQEKEGVTDLQGFLKLHVELWNQIEEKLKFLNK